MAQQLLKRVVHCGKGGKLKLAASLLRDGARANAPVNFLARAMSTSPAESFMSGSNSVYVEEMYRAWLKDNSSVHKSWDIYFSALESGVTEGAFYPAPGLQSSIGMPSSAVAVDKSDSLGLSYLIRAYQFRGHEAAKLDPLGLHAYRPATPPPELDHKFHGFTDADLDRVMNLKGTSVGGHKGYLGELARGPQVTLRKVIERLKQTYCQTMGVEYMHMGSRERCNWIRTRVETPLWLTYSQEKKMHIYERLAFADMFERFLGSKYNTSKRFGLDGGESVIPGMKAMVDRASEMGVTDFVFGMPHRGRLNTLVNVLRKPMQMMFKEFEGTHFSMEKHQKKNDWSSSGDVKYHLGTSMTRKYPDGRQIHLSLLANPSHLEAADPVVEGKTRAKQFYMGDTDEDKKKVIPVLLHGDAAFAGQGILYEVMQLAKVKDFANGGTIHVVVNNQVGFTTDPMSSRSTPYCTDLGKAFDVPIFHCNGDDPLAVVTAFEMATDWRQAWGEDCIIDMLCYRRHGHNELDQPLFTQPLLYNQIAKHPSTQELFKRRLISDGTFTQAEMDAVDAGVKQAYEQAYEESKTWDVANEDWLANKWEGFKSPSQLSRIRETGMHVDRLRDVGEKICSVPEGFVLHKQLEKILAARRKTIQEGKGIDWGTAEALAFGTLLLEGNHVRLTGQDVERGTFSHRHAVLHDMKTNQTHCPLNHLRPNVNNIRKTTDPPIPNSQAKLVIRNSILSEYGVLGFETGYSLESPNALVLWEAQFGDFANGAQIMFDQFIASGESKWLRQCGIVVLLPHGYDGQGPEHSSCRVERFLQLSDDDEDVLPEMSEDVRRQIQHTNWQIVNCTTPANYYHVLRRQIHRDFRKPLIVVAPKALLRHKMAVSTIESMASGTRFHRIYREHDPEIKANPDKVTRVCLCSGKVYYDVLQERDARGIKDVAIVRVEQLTPFPFDKVADEIGKYKNIKKVRWVQEEPKNAGPWSYVAPRIRTATRGYLKKEWVPEYVGRAPCAAPATGMAKVHEKEQRALVEHALSE